MVKGGNKANIDAVVAAEKNEVADLRRRLESVERDLSKVISDNNKLQRRVDQLEGRVAITENTSSLLRSELDRLDQYHRRSNIQVKFVELPANHSQASDNNFIRNLLQNDLKLSHAYEDIDKLHRIGKIREKNGKQNQDIIIRFRSHLSRYDVYNNRKHAKNCKVRPNLTPQRNDLLYDAATLVENIDGVEFAFANAHGDINVRLTESLPNGKQHFAFSSLSELKQRLLENNFNLPIGC